MSHWDYRVVEHLVPGIGPYRSIHEVYYDDDQITSWVATPSTPFGETEEDLRSDVLLMSAALDLPVLQAIDMPAAPDEELP